MSSSRSKPNGIVEVSLVRLKSVRREVSLSEQKTQIAYHKVFVNMKGINSFNKGYQECPNGLVLILRRLTKAACEQFYVLRLVVASIEFR